MYGVCVVTRPAGLGLDVRVLDERRFEDALGDGGARAERGLRVALLDRAVEQQVARLAGLHFGCILRHRGIEPDHRGQRLPVDGKGGFVEGLDRFARADDRRHRLAAKARLAFSEHRLVLDVRVDAEAVRRHVGRGQHALEARCVAHERLQIAEAETRAVMRRAQRPQPQRIGRHGVGAEALGTGQLRNTVDLRHACADGLAGAR